MISTDTNYYTFKCTVFILAWWASKLYFVSVLFSMSYILMIGINEMHITYKGISNSYIMTFSHILVTSTNIQFVFFWMYSPCDKNDKLCQYHKTNFQTLINLKTYNRFIKHLLTNMSFRQQIIDHRRTSKRRWIQLHSYLCIYSNTYIPMFQWVTQKIRPQQLSLFRFTNSQIYSTTCFGPKWTIFRWSYVKDAIDWRNYINIKITLKKLKID
jgi:hypothetical protein